MSDEALIVRCNECDAIARRGCPRCQARLCDAHAAAASPWCGHCAIELYERQSRVSLGRVTAVALGALVGGVGGGTGGLLFCALLMNLGFPAELAVFVILLSVIGGVGLGIFGANRAITRHEQHRFLEEGAPALPQARLVK